MTQLKYRQIIWTNYLQLYKTYENNFITHSGGDTYTLHLLGSIILHLVHWQKWNFCKRLCWLGCGEARILLYRTTSVKGNLQMYIHFDPVIPLQELLEQKMLSYAKSLT